MHTLSHYTSDDDDDDDDQQQQQQQQQQPVVRAVAPSTGPVLPAPRYVRHMPPSASDVGSSNSRVVRGYVPKRARLEVTPYSRPVNTVSTVGTRAVSSTPRTCPLPPSRTESSGGSGTGVWKPHAAASASGVTNHPPRRLLRRWSGHTDGVNRMRWSPLRGMRGLEFTCMS